MERRVSSTKAEVLTFFALTSHEAPGYERQEPEAEGGRKPVCSSRHARRRGYDSEALRSTTPAVAVLTLS